MNYSTLAYVCYCHLSHTFQFTNCCFLYDCTVNYITLVINLKPDTLTSLTNSAILIGTGSLGNAVRDTSNTGYDPDPNSNNNASDVGENKPTVIILPDVDLFIPEVFTPNGMVSMMYLKLKVYATSKLS